MNNISLRQWKDEDAEALAAIADNKNVWNNLRDQLPHPYTIDDARDWITHCKNQKPLVNFAIIYNGEVAGSIGCVPKADVYCRNVEIGYFIGEKFWGKGIATEAVRILIEYILNHFEAVRIYAEVFAHNKASMKVLQKNGFYLESIRRRGAYKNQKIIDDYVWVKLL